MPVEIAVTCPGCGEIFPLSDALPQQAREVLLAPERERLRAQGFREVATRIEVLERELAEQEAARREHELELIRREREVARRERDRDLERERERRLDRQDPEGLRGGPG